MIRSLTIVFFLLLPAFLFAARTSLAIGTPLEVKMIGLDKGLHHGELTMSIDSDKVTGLQSGKDKLYLYDDQRNTLIQYLELARGWQLSGVAPDLSKQEMYQVCEGRESKGAIGLVRAESGVPYVVMILTDEDRQLASGMRIFLSHKAVYEMILKLDNAPMVYSELMQRIDERKKLYEQGASSKRSKRAFDSTSRRGRG